MVDGYPGAVSLDPHVTSVLAVVGVALGALGLLLGIVAQVRLRRLRRAYTVLQAGEGDLSFVEAAARTVRSVDDLRADVAVVQSGIEEVRTDLADAIRHVAVV